MLKSRFNLLPGEEGQEEEETEAMPEEPPVVIVMPDIRILKKPEVSTRLSVLGKTADGDGYTYLKATCTGMKLTDISALKCFKHLQFVDVSNNFLNLNALQVATELPFLIFLQADNNGLKSAALKRAKYLQVIILNDNQIETVSDVYQPELSTLEIGNNKIKTLSFTAKLPNLKVLDFRNNMIQDIFELDFPSLDSLYLAGNQITTLIGIDKMVNLRILHVRNNPIRFLNGFDPAMTKLQYINLRNCRITTLRQVKKLQVLKSLDTLVLKGCPYMGGTGEEDPEGADEEEDPELRVEVLATLQRLKRLNKAAYTPEERSEAKDLMTQWLEEGEKEEDEEVDEQQNEEELNMEG